MAYLDLGDVDEAERVARPRGRGRRREPDAAPGAPAGDLARARARRAAGDAEGMRAHLERAVELAAEQGQPAARCEALARLALEAVRAGRRDAATRSCSDVAERSAQRGAELAPHLPGHPPWGAQADAALARVALARGDDGGGAAELRARSARQLDGGACTRTSHLDDPAPGGAASSRRRGAGVGARRAYVGQLALAMIAQRTLDEDVRVRWFRGPVGAELTRARRADRGDRPAATVDEPGVDDGRGRRRAAPEPRAGADERRDRRGARHRRGRGRAAAGRAVRAGSARPRAPRPRRSRSGSGSCEDGARCCGRGSTGTGASARGPASRSRPPRSTGYEGDFAKADVADAASVEEELLREAALACPTGAIVGRGGRGAAAVAAPRQGGAAPRREDVHVHGHRELDQPGRGARATRRGRASCAGTTRRCGRCSPSTAARRSWRPATGSSSGSTRPTRRSRARSRSSAGWPSTAGRTASRRRCGSACTRPARRRSGGTSPARACTRRRGSRRSREGGRDPREPGHGGGVAVPRRRSRATVTLRGTSEPVEIVTVDWR